jgi:hypothetical protein
MEEAISFQPSALSKISTLRTENQKLKTGELKSDKPESDETESDELKTDLGDIGSLMADS